MAIAVQFDFKDVTLEQYDQVLQKMGLHHGGPGGPGALFHWITKTADGIRVVDVWQSRAAFDKFAEEKIGPITQEIFKRQPEMQFFDVYNHLTAG